MQFYNSLTKKKEKFEPQQEGNATMYVCGLTPYDHTHIGHARTYVAFDMLKRHLVSSGIKVFHIQNITDVEDKVIRRAKETGANPLEMAGKYHGEAMELLSRLHVLPADVYPKVSEHIPEIIGLVKTIMENGYAYETGTGVYFEVSKFADYGKLSGQKLDEIRAGSRKEVDETKRNPEDFALWKKTKGDIMEFDSPWGRGRPGWHIECSAMAGKYAKTLDIHGGARDLVFPHHENEIAQSEAAGARPFVRYWLHTGFLTVKGEKMSKSLGNFVTLKDVLDTQSPNAVRMFFALAHYRSPIDYNPDQIKQAEATVERMLNFVGALDRALSEKKKPAVRDAALAKEMESKFRNIYAFIDNDLDIPNALAYVFSVMKSVNTHLDEDTSCDYETMAAVRFGMERVLYVIGIEREKKKEIGDRAEGLVKLLIELREEARKKKDFATSDMIRERLRGMGIALEDGDGTRWKAK